MGWVGGSEGGLGWTIRRWAGLEGQKVDWVGGSEGGLGWRVIRWAGLGVGYTYETKHVALCKGHSV